MTTNIRKDYNKLRSVKDRQIDEAARMWLSNNVIFISEKIDRKSIDRLINSIQKFDNKFGAYRNLIPSITSVINQAEEDLQNIITGKSEGQRAGEILGYLSSIYNCYSNFFSKDLPVLTKTKLFRVAMENSDTPMNRITDDGFDIKPIKKAIAHAVEPTAEEKKLLKGLLKRKYIVDANAVADDLVNLSFNDLRNLMEIDKVPIVSTVNESVVLKETPKKKTLNEGILFEATIEEIGTALGSLKSVADSLNIPDIAKSVNQLHSDLLAAKAGGKMDQVIQQIQGQDKRALADVFKSKEGQLLKQANMAIETFKKLGDMWPQIKKMIDKDDVSLQDLNNVRTILNKEVGGSYFKKLSQNFGVATKPYPGLEPTNIVSKLMTTLDKSVQQEQAVPAKTHNIPPSNAIAADVLTKFKSNFEKLYNFSKTGTSATVSGTKGTKGTKPTTGTASKSKETQSTTPTGETQDTTKVPGLVQKNYDSKMISDIAQKLNSKPEQINKILAALLGAGYKVQKI